MDRPESIISFLDVMNVVIIIIFFFCRELVVVLDVVGLAHGYKRCLTVQM